MLYITNQSILSNKSHLICAKINFSGLKIVKNKHN